MVTLDYKFKYVLTPAFSKIIWCVWACILSLLVVVFAFVFLVSVPKEIQSFISDKQAASAYNSDLDNLTETDVLITRLDAQLDALRGKPKKTDTDILEELQKNKKEGPSIMDLAMSLVWKLLQLIIYITVLMGLRIVLETVRVYHLETR